MQHHPLDEGKPTGIEIRDGIAAQAEPSATEELPKKEPKPNRRMKRVMHAQAKKKLRVADQASARRLTCFRKLEDRVALEKAKGRMPIEQIDLVFKIALNRLFKKDFKKAEEFDCKLNAIVMNVRMGNAVYKEMPPKAAPEMLPAEAAAAANPA